METSLAGLTFTQRISKVLCENDIHHLHGGRNKFWFFFKFIEIEAYFYYFYFKSLNLSDDKIIKA